MASLAPLVANNVKVEPQIVDISSVESQEIPTCQIVSLHEASGPISDYSATPYGHMISHRTQRKLGNLQKFILQKNLFFLGGILIKKQISAKISNFG